MPNAKMADLCEQLGADTVGKYGYSAVGVGVSETYPAQLAELRERQPHTFFLIQGYGGQGGGTEGVAAAFDANGLDGIVNSSHGIMCAYQKEDCDPHDFSKAVHHEAIRMRDEFTSFVKVK